MTSQNFSSQLGTGGNSPTSGGTPQTPTTPGSNTPYFADFKKGEVQELKTLLRTAGIDKDPERKRDIIKKVIYYMTLGIDVSKLFSEMVMAAYTKDMVQKKLIYLYLSNYADSNPDLAIMGINTLRKDCSDENPMVRGLALRSLCSLRLANLVEYVLDPIAEGLNDASAYVRKSAVIGLVKIYYISPSTVKESSMVNKLYDMLRDKDSQVIINCIQALNEILHDEGGMALNKSIVHHLLNKLKELSEWGQCTVLQLIVRYVPDGEDEIFDIMNILEERLKHSNSAVVLCAINVFLHITQNMPEILKQVYQRVKPPLLTLMNSPNVGMEGAFTCLHHINLLIDQSPGLLCDEYKHFFCRYNDASYVKSLKLDILTKIANSQNMQDIIVEVAAYVCDVDAELARSSIQAIGKIAILVSNSVNIAIEHLLSFLELEMDYVTAETVIVLKDILRKYPDFRQDIIPQLQSVSRFEDTKARTAWIWMLGEYGESIDDAPYILENMVNTFMEETSHGVKLMLLTSMVKLFFKRPPECQRALGQLLSSAISDENHQDVHDRALLYYRLLTKDLDEANRVISAPSTIVTNFTEEQNREIQDRIFEEFNTLSVIYGQPSERFTNLKKMGLEKELPTTAGNVLGNANNTPANAPTNEDKLSRQSSNSSLREESYAPPGENLVELDGSMTDNNGFANNEALHLRPKVTIEPPAFQKKWGALQQVGTSSFDLQWQPQELGDVIRHMKQFNIACIASGQPQSTQWKFYFYAVNQVSNVAYFVETLIKLPSMSLTAKFKSEETNVQDFVQFFNQVILAAQ